MHKPEQPSDISQRTKIVLVRENSYLKAIVHSGCKSSLYLGPKGYATEVFNYSTCSRSAKQFYTLPKGAKKKTKKQKITNLLTVDVL